MSAMQKGDAIRSMEAHHNAMGARVGGVQQRQDVGLCTVVMVGLGHICDALLEIRDVLDDIRQGNQ